MSLKIADLIASFDSSLLLPRSRRTTTYADFLVERTFEDHASRARSDIVIARACGYRYEFVVGDAELAVALSKLLALSNVVRHEPKCNRKGYKAGKIKVKTP